MGFADGSGGHEGLETMKPRKYGVMLLEKEEIQFRKDYYHSLFRLGLLSRPVTSFSSRIVWLTLFELPRRGKVSCGTRWWGPLAGPARADNQSTCTDAVRDEGAYGYRQYAVSPGRAMNLFYF